MNEQTTVDTSKSKYFLYIAIAFVAILMVSNTTGGKLIGIGPFVFAGAIFIFPLSYIFGDVLTEVYGYRATRKIIWSAFAAIIFMSLSYLFIIARPPASFWTGQEALATTLGLAPRIALASILAFFVGEFSNSCVLSRMKVLMNGKRLWMRTIGSTVVGEGIDTVVFVTVAFYGTIPLAVLVTTIWSGYLFKVLYEVIATPMTYFVVGWLKRAEGIDVYDKGISYNPFHISEKV